jgi:hypothetical protein
MHQQGHRSIPKIQSRHVPLLVPSFGSERQWADSKSPINMSQWPKCASHAHKPFDGTIDGRPTSVQHSELTSKVRANIPIVQDNESDMIWKVLARLVTTENADFSTKGTRSCLSCRAGIPRETFTRVPWKCWTVLNGARLDDGSVPRFGFSWESKDCIREVNLERGPKSANLFRILSFNLGRRHHLPLKKIGLVIPISCSGVGFELSPFEHESQKRFHFPYFLRPLFG